MNLYNRLKDYMPYNKQEEADREAFIRFLEKNENCFSRENEKGHITVSAWIVNENRDKVLFCYHNIYDSWSWVGGHADGEENLLSVAVKEAREETGAEVTPVWNDIFSVEILPVAGHIKKGKYISSHIHYNVTYLVEAREAEKLSVCEDENSAVEWIEADRIKTMSSEKWMVENIYSKLIERMKKI